MHGICNKKSINPTFATSNRINLNQDGTNDYTFDNAGNTTKSADGNTFIYDAENKQIEVKNSSNVTIGQYWYDGDGKRVKKYVPSTGEITLFVYDAGGKMVAEYSTVTATTPQVSYLMNDHLGSPRIITNENGAVTSRRDFQPFGEEISSAQRTTTLGYAADNIREKFATYERDTETDLDFAQARMYANKLGRFTTVDPIFLEKNRLTDPQAINLYVYTRNSPLIYVDPDGRIFVDGNGNVIDVNDDLEVSCKKCNKNSKQFKSLVKLAKLIKDSRSQAALKKFNALRDSDGKVQIIIGEGFKDVGGGLHQPKGKFYDKKGNVSKKEGFLKYDVNSQGFNGVANTVEGQDVYEEAVITIDLEDLRNQFEDFKKTGSPDLTFDEFIVLTFNHEAKHNLDPEQVRAFKNGEKGFPNEKGSKENTQDFLDELKEIKKSQKKN
ncbi:hypothetical protein BH10ACI1_BH10ACI1_08560 [soil metagenome]